jgi:hypothetical protein
MTLTTVNSLQEHECKSLSFVFQSTNAKFGLLPMAVAAARLIKKHNTTYLLYRRGRPPWPSLAWRSHTRAAPRPHPPLPSRKEGRGRSTPAPPSTSPIVEGEVGEAYACTPIHLAPSAGRGGMRHHSSAHKVGNCRQRCCISSVSGVFKHAASLCLKYFSCFRCMFQMFLIDVVKVDRDVPYAAMVVHIFYKCFYLYVSYVSRICWKCFI